jgi:RNA polymerase sigma factor (sigma-70 family)
MVGMKAESSGRPSAHELFEKYRPLAAKIAAGFSNIPRATQDEIETTAEQALWDSARNFENRDGQFEAYAMTSIRNRLKDLHRKSIRLDDRLPLHEPPAGTDLPPPEPASSPSPVVEQIARNETAEHLDRVLGGMDPRKSEVLRRTAAGESGSEIGKALGISKQMVSKILASAREEAQENIHARGLRYEGCALNSQRPNDTPEPRADDFSRPGAWPGEKNGFRAEPRRAPSPPLGLWGRFLRAIGLRA